jgi:hypothetical protein
VHVTVETQEGSSSDLEQELLSLVGEALAEESGEPISS